MDYIAIAGSIASILGAIFSLRESVKAKSSKKEAEKLYNAIAREQRKISISKIHSDTKAALETSRKMTTPANPSKKIAGLDYQSCIEQLRKYIDQLKEFSLNFEDANKKKLIKHYNNIEKQLPKLGNEDDLKKKYELGEQIHKTIGNILEITSSELSI